jgi:hypothetical protein
LGMGGNGPLSQFAVLREYLLRHRAEKFVWLVVTNDIARGASDPLPIDFEAEIGHAGLARYVHDENYRQDYFSPERVGDYADRIAAFADAYYMANKHNIANLRRKQRPVAGIVVDIVTGRPVLSRIGKLKTGGGKKPGSTGRKWRQIDSKAKQQVLQLYRRGYELARESGAELSFVFLQSKALCYGAYETDPFGFVREFFDQQGIPYLDFAQGEEGGQCARFYARKQGGHYTAAGYGALADALLESLY